LIRLLGGGQWVLTWERVEGQPRCWIMWTKVIKYKANSNFGPWMWPEEQGEHTQVALCQVLGNDPAFGDWVVVPKLKKFNPICTN
jgi:hypothetical protein